MKKIIYVFFFCFAIVFLLLIYIIYDQKRQIDKLLEENKIIQKVEEPKEENMEQVRSEVERYLDSFVNNSYTKNFQKISNVSEISSISVNKDLESYIYSFDYLENGQKFNLKIIWIETENGYYVIDINFPSNLSDNFSNLIKEITSSFTLY